MKMNAVLLRDITPADKIRLEEKEIPKVRPGWVLIKVHAFGLNHSEKLLRHSEIRADYIPKPVTPGIECAGEVADPSDSSFGKGQKVIAFMGGMGRSFDGSYAEYVLVPVKQVFSVESDLPWAMLGAIPETYYTAWGSLFQGLKLAPGDTLLVRGATSALGYAAIQLAKALGSRVIATTHRQEKLPLLEDADEAVLDNGLLAGKLTGVTKALELIGPRTLRDTLNTVVPGAMVCNTGVLGGQYLLQDFDPIKEIPNGVWLTGFFSNSPTQRIMDDIFGFFRLHQLKPRMGAVFPFTEIQKALLAQDTGSVNGKIVVLVESRLKTD